MILKPPRHSIPSGAVARRIGWKQIAGILSILFLSVSSAETWTYRTATKESQAWTIPCKPDGEFLIHAPEKNIQLVADYPQFGTWIVAEGKWRRTSGPAMSIRLPEINSVYIDCYERTGKCTERRATLVSRAEAERLNVPLLEGLLDTSFDEYEIAEWTADFVRAVYRAPVGDIEIQISVKNKTATRSYRERPDATDKPISNYYVLE